jgi:serine/threonine protein kinase/Tfp pilus assembly protein PilF
MSGGLPGSTRFQSPTRTIRDDYSAVERLAEDMVERWHKGERPLTEHFLEQCPSLRENSEAVLELIAEELALREEFREPVSIATLNERFPLWPSQIRALVECQRALGSRLVQFPSAGSVLGEFHLASELGRGAHARVFLASQPSLGNRRVVLKLGPAVGQEHLSLARLQHTHIVPLYSVHEFPSHGLRGLCLPYFGGVTLSEVLSKIDSQGKSVTGGDLLAIIQRDCTEEAGLMPANAFAEVFKSSTSIDVFCWIGACLADALQYAHDRGLLHLDLKPSNVLVAADGVPMLLDFHLARPPLRVGDAAPSWLGGTPGYMAPEHVVALQAVREGARIPTALDARADVYSLGVVLREALSGAVAGKNGEAISVGLADILARSTAREPLERYTTAFELAKDLRRHLSNQSLSGVPNRSLTERWRKWRRRRPLAFPLILAFSALVAGFAGLAIYTGRLSPRAYAAQRDGLTQLSQGHYAEAVENFRAGELLAGSLPFHAKLRAILHEERLIAERGRAALELHQACEQMRPLYAADATPAQSQLVEKRCREFWDQRDLFAATLSGQLTPELERQWRADLLDVVILATRLRENFVLPPARQEYHRDALATLEQAEQFLGPSAILLLERGRHARALGQYSVAEEATAQARSQPLETAWDHIVVGRYYLASGDMRRSLSEMNHALERDPQSLWAHYFKGTCCARSGRPIEAVSEFSACAAIAPSTAWCVHNLGQAYLEAGELELALAAFDRALALDPGLAASFLGRAAIHLKKGRYSDALADLNRAANGGIPLAEVEYRRGLVYLASGDRASSLASLRSCLKRDPRHIQAQQALERALGQAK